MDIKINASWFRFLEDLPAEEIKKVVRAIWDYTQGKEVQDVKSAAWETIKASIDFQIQRKQELSEKRRQAIKARWAKIKESSEPQPEIVEPEIIVPQNKFVSMTDDPSIRAELENPDSAISVFLKTGSRYDDLSKTECEFADRADVRAKCEWHKEIQAATREIKNPMPPTEEEVLAYAREQNSIAGMGGFACSDEEALNFFDYYSGLGWHVPNSANTPLRVWKPFLRKWARSPLRSLQQFKPRMSLKDIKESENHIKLQKMLDGEL